MSTIDEYLQAVTPSQRMALERVRKIVKDMVPDAEEAISYGIPTLKYQYTYLLYFAAYNDHMSIFGSMQSVEDKLGAFKISKKGTLQFTEDNQVPEEIIREIVANRLAELRKGKA